MISVRHALIAFASIAAGVYYAGFAPFPVQAIDETERFSCRPFLPKVFIETPPSADDAFVSVGLEQLAAFFSRRFAHGDIDSLSVAVVTSQGAVFEQNYGVIRGNESETSPPTTSHSSYRVASVSKLFAVLEGLVLEQRGVLAWDDPVDEYLPHFTPRLDGFTPHSRPQGHSPITLFQLASHMSGLGRDWPPGTVSEWPFNIHGGGPPPTNGHPFPTHESLYDAISAHHLTSPPWSYPAYSNTGTGLLGLALVAANRMASEHPEREPHTYAALLKRDIFDPMRLNGSHFLTTDENKDIVVIPSIAPEVVDQNFLDAMNPAGGQFSSLSDCIKVVQTLLNPAHPVSLLSRSSMDKWLQPVHDFEEDDWTQIGLVWEIIKARDSNGRPRKVYWKLGAMAGYHAAIAIHPGTSYGVIILMGARYPDAAKLAYDAFEIMQPFMDSALATLSRKLYAGKWESSDGNSSASIVVEKGTLYISNLVLNGSDVLPMFNASERVPLRSSERRDEFRLDFGIPFYNGQKHMGCYVYWNGQDIWGLRNNAPINLLYFTDSGNDRVLHYPSADVIMRRS
ncbi:hypothetical protein PHLCEN_2v5562 [Hermanssonia centrifuga]|uniref:Beta-lactamase-related domain-containing protein n=1 Tax=Hermanssonia centrifuga TaxID=98765 RepID=A0A2R6P232_9APHY|nr:hypothetical protein PHLCEN_2v5562 [Hermanssonia centrifuga]